MEGSDSKMPKDCIFCKIISGKLPSKKVFENSDVLAFHDVSPAMPTHILFVPKKHYDSLAHLDDAEVMKKLFAAILEVTNREGIADRGYRTVINTGEQGGQTVFHLHVHLLGGKKMGTQMV